MAYVPLKITFMFANDLKNPHCVSKMQVYAVVYINVDPQNKLRTPADKDDGCNPEWNYTINLIVEETAANQYRLNLVIKLMSDGLLGPKDIGEVEVPIKEFLDRREKVFAYDVRSPKGKKKGTLNLCWEIGEKFSVLVAGQPRVTERGTSARTPVMAYPAAWSSAGYTYNYSPQFVHPPPPPPGYGYTGNPPYGGHGYMPIQPPAPGLGQTPAGRLFSNIFIVGMLSDILADFTSMLDGGMLDGLLGFF